MMTVYLNGDGRTMLDLDIQFCMQPDVLEEDIIVRALKDVEHIYKIEGLAMYSTDFGVKSPESLSNGIKCLILCYYNAKGKYDDLLSNACMGDNVGPYLQELSLKYDFNIAWDCFLDVDWKAPICAKDSETGNILTNGEEFAEFYCGRAHA